MTRLVFRSLVSSFRALYGMFCLDFYASLDYGKCHTQNTGHELEYSLVAASLWVTWSSGVCGNTSSV